VVSDDENSDPSASSSSQFGNGLYYDHLAYDDDSRAVVRPLLDRVQLTPAGLERRSPVAMVMVGGGDVAYHQLAMAERVGITRRYHVESQGMRVRNLIVDDGDAGVMVRQF
jgi:hypothetical protein